MGDGTGEVREDELRGKQDERARLEAVQRYRILDTAPEGAYDDLTKLAAHIAGTPISLVSLVDESRQWFKSNHGLNVRETPRSLSFCAHAIDQEKPLEVQDALADPRFKDNDLVLGPPNIRYYAGAQLVTPDGFRLGTLCVIDRKPRKLTDEQLELLAALSRQVVVQMELRRQAHELADTSAKLREAKARLEKRVEERTAELRSAVTSLLTQAEEARKAEHLAREREGQLAHAQKLATLGQLAGGIAHDFNNLLTVIIGYSELAAAGLPPGSPATDDMREVMRAAARARDLTAHLLATTRRRPAQPEVLDLRESFQDLGRLLARLIRENVRLDLQTAEDLWPVRIDGRHLEQALVNLAVNARDAMPDGGLLRIEARNVYLEHDLSEKHALVPAGDYVRIAVTDSGPGMPQDVLDRLFQPFFTTKGSGEGAGLGLATSSWMLAQDGGFITAHSEAGRGSAFHIYLPRYPGDKEEMVTSDRPDLSWSGRETLLFVEDDAAIRGVATRVLREKGYSVIEAGHGTEALEQVERKHGPIQLAIVDVVLPGLGGPELVRRLRARTPALRVLYTSGYTELTSPADGAFLPKPYSPGMLLDRVRHALDAENA